MAKKLLTQILILLSIILHFTKAGINYFQFVRTPDGVILYVNRQEVAESETPISKEIEWISVVYKAPFNLTSDSTEEPLLTTINDTSELKLQADIDLNKTSSTPQSKSKGVLSDYDLVQNFEFDKEHGTAFEVYLLLDC